MTLAVAIQMDPLESVNISADSTFVMALEAQKRGHTLYHYLAKDLSYRQGDIVAKARPFTLRLEQGNHVSFGAFEQLDLRRMDVVLMRQDPPFNLAYISATHLLDNIHPKTLVVNDPTSVRNAPEKLFVTEFADLMPPTLITYDMAEIKRFRTEYKDIIVKPLYGNGGAGVFRIREDDTNLNSLIELFAAYLNEPLMVQAYIPAVRAGDRRVILIDGEPVGAINRVPAADDTRANMHAGGRAEQIGLSKRDLDICAQMGPKLRERGLIFVGIDIIGDYLTEINVTSPTGIQEINRFDNVCLESQLWDTIAARLA